MKIQFRIAKTSNKNNNDKNDKFKSKNHIYIRKK